MNEKNLHPNAGQYPRTPDLSAIRHQDVPPKSEARIVLDSINELAERLDRLLESLTIKTIDIRPSVGSPTNSGGSASRALSAPLFSAMYANLCDCNDAVAKLEYVVSEINL